VVRTEADDHIDVRRQSRLLEDPEFQMNQISQVLTMLSLRRCVVGRILHDNENTMRPRPTPLRRVATKVSTRLRSEHDTRFLRAYVPSLRGRSLQ